MRQNNRIRILTIIRNPLGGIRTYIKYTYGSFNKSKYQITILTAKEEEEDSKHIKGDLKNLDVDVCEVQGKQINILLLINIVKILLKSKFNIIHSQGFTVGILTALVNMISRVPHIITLHETLRNEQFSSFKGKIKRKVLGYLLGKVDIIQTVSEDAQQNLIDFLPALKNKKDKLVVIRNGIHIELFKGNNDSNNHVLRKEIGIDDTFFLFGFLGRFMPEKGFTYLIDAVQELSRDSDFHDSFKILAVNDGDYIREYKKIIKRKKLEKYFFFYGFVPDVSTVIRQLDAVIMPSLREAYSLLPIEAFVMGCPVIATDCIGLREVIKDTPAIIVKSKDSLSIANGMMKFMQNPNSFKEKTRAFIRTAEERFTVKYTAEKLDLIFNDLVAPKPVGK